MALAVTAAALLAGCGGGDGGDGSDGGPKKVDVKEGRSLFKAQCAACHTLADADAQGTFGPDLDELQPSYEETLSQTKSGGGGMPADLYTGEKAETVAAYVAEAAGS